MAQQIQVCDVKRNVVTIPPCKNTIDVHHLKNGTGIVRTCALQLEGNWQKHGTYIELLESTDFKVSGECQLKAGEDPYVGHFLVGLAKQHTMGKVKIAKSPPHEESEEDFTYHKPGTMKSITLGLCNGNVKFCLTGYEPHWKMQKGLIIYGVTFTPMKKP